MIAEIAAGFSSLKAAASLLEGLNAANTQVQVNDVKLALQGRLFEVYDALATAQTANAAALTCIGDLEQQIVNLKDWETEKHRYHLGAIDGVAFVYVHKPGMENGEPPHWLCQTCFENGKKRVFQFQKTTERMPITNYRNIWACGGCNKTISVSMRVTPANPTPQPPEPPVPPQTIIPQ